MDTKKYLNRREAAAHLTALGLKTSPGTLQKLASIGGGPIYQIYGRESVYTQANLNAYAEAKLSAPRRSTSDIAA